MKIGSHSCTACNHHFKSQINYKISEYNLIKVWMIAKGYSIHFSGRKNEKHEDKMKIQWTNSMYNIKANCAKKEKRAQSINFRKNPKHEAPPNIAIDYKNPIYSIDDIDSSIHSSLSYCHNLGSFIVATNQRYGSAKSINISVINELYYLWFLRIIKSNVHIDRVFSLLLFECRRSWS